MRLAASLPTGRPVPHVRDWPRRINKNIFVVPPKVRGPPEVPLIRRPKAGPDRYRQCMGVNEIIETGDYNEQVV